MMAAICTEMSELLLRAQAFSRAGGQRFVLGEYQEIGSRLNANLQWVSVRAPCNCLLSFLENRWLSRLLEDVEIIIIGSVIVVLIQLLLWKSVGTFCVSLWELSQSLHLFKSICLHLMLFHRIMKMPGDYSWGLWCRHERPLQAKDLYSFVSFLCRNLNLQSLG